MKPHFLAPGALAIAALSLTGCADPGFDGEEESAAPHLESDRGGIGVARQALDSGPVTIDARRSLAVTDTAILSSFSLAEVLNKLAAQSGVAGLTATLLWKQLWDTQNPKPGQTTGPHCNDVVVNGVPQLNTYPYACRPGEGGEATNPATSMGQYAAIGLFNRFDLAPADGSDCGEYRIVFGKTSGAGRNFVIFEAVLPNPTPEFGLDGCRSITGVWRDLSSENSVAARAAALHSFYFQGAGGSLPVVHIDNYGNGAPSRKTGQIRTNQFIQGPWMLRELKLQKTCAGGPCKLQFVPTTDKTNPFGGLFSSSSTHAQRGPFQSFFASQVAALAVNDVNRFNYVVPDQFNAGESVSQAPSSNDYVAQFSASGSFAGAIQAQLTAIGSPLTPGNIVARAQALSCAGCHELSNGQSLGGGVTWPSSAGFVHVTESTANGPDGPRFILSTALTSVFLPHREAVLEDFLRRPEVCMHDPCDEGARLLWSCDPCVTSVCEADNFCCNTEWDGICVDEATSLCGLTCS
jgi:hypothetical protein